jgi:hypothetical protein
MSVRVRNLQGSLPDRTASGEFVINLFFEKQHVLTSQLAQQTEQLRSTQDTIEA